MPVRKIYDPWLFLTCMVLATGGVLIVGSASVYWALHHDGDPSSLFWKQGRNAAFGCAVLLVTLRLPYGRLDDGRVLRRMFAVCLVLLVAVLFMAPIGGARRWLHGLGFALQPSEFTKLFVVIYMASMLARGRDRINDFRQFQRPCLVVVGSLALLVLIEPDLGAALMLCAMAVVMAFAAGLHRKYVWMILGAGFVGFWAAVLAAPYRLRRVIDFFLVLFGFREPGYQLEQSILAVGRGGLTGVGLGFGRQKGFVPASHTDFIYSVIAEELGLLGAMTILAAFLLIFWRGIQVARRTKDPFGCHLALGLTCLLVCQGLVNMAVCLGALPTKGLSLPLISYGGSSLVASMAAVGLLLNVSQESNLVSRGRAGGVPRGR